MDPENRLKLRQTEQFSTEIYCDERRNAGSLPVNENVYAERAFSFALAEITLYSSPIFPFLRTLQKISMRAEMASLQVHTFKYVQYIPATVISSVLKQYYS